MPLSLLPDWRYVHLPAALGRVVAWCCLSALVLATTSTHASAQNQLTNPGFDMNLAGWTTGPSASFDGTRDAAGSPASGSARFARTVGGGDAIETLVIVSQCVNGIVPGATYEFGGQVLVDAAPAGGSAGIVLGWQADAGCSGLISLEATAPIASAPGTWQTRTRPIVAPAGVASAEITTFAGVAPLGPGPVSPEMLAIVAGAYEVNMDNLRVTLVSQPVPTMGEIWLFALALILATTGALWLRASQRRPAV